VRGTFPLFAFAFSFFERDVSCSMYLTKTSPGPSALFYVEYYGL